MKRILIDIGLIIVAFVLTQVPMTLAIIFGSQPAYAIGLSVAILLLIAFFIWSMKRLGLWVLPERLQNSQWTRQDTYWLAGGLLAMWGVNVMLSLLMEALGMGETTVNQELIAQVMGQIPSYLSFLLVTVFAAVTEEAIFRGLIIGRLFQGQEKWGLLASALIFGGLHLSDNPISYLIYMSMGLVMGLAYIKTGKLAVPMGIHFLNNLLAFAVMNLPLNL
ncbi:CPBP family intramembrane glutamic endopeptidase [Hutsoniella sourekii]